MRDSGSEVEEIFNKFTGKQELEKKLAEFLRQKKDIGKPVDAKKLYFGIKKATEKALENYKTSPCSLRICLKIIHGITSSESCDGAHSLFINLGVAKLVLDGFRQVLQVIGQNNGESLQSEEELLLSALEIIISIGDFSNEGLNAVANCVPKCLELVADEKRLIAVRLEATKFLNSGLQVYRAAGGTFAALKFVNFFDNLLIRAGDLELQLCMTELLFRILVSSAQRQAQAAQWFKESETFRRELLGIREEEFESDCRKFLNKLNESQPENRLVHSLPCKEVYLGTFKVSCAMDGDHGWFWTDYNFGSRSLTFFACDNSNDDCWETVIIKAENVIETRINEKQGCNEVVLVITLKEKSVSSLVSFCPEQNASYVKFVYDEKNNPIKPVKSVFDKPPYLIRKTPLSPDIIASTPPKTSVAINSVQLSSRSKGVAQTSVVETQFGKNPRRSSRSRPNKSTDKPECTKNGGPGDQQGNAGTSWDPKEHLGQNNSAAQDSGVAEESVNSEPGGTIMKDAGDNKATQDSDCVIIEETVGNAGDTEGQEQDKQDVEDTEKDVIGETQSIAGSQRGTEDNWEFDDEVAVAETSVDKVTERPMKDNVTGKARRESEGQSRTSGSARDTTPTKPGKQRKGRIPRAKPAPKKSKSRKLVTSTSESEQPATQTKKKAAPKKPAPKKAAENTKPVVRTRSQRSKPVSMDELGTGYNTEDWRFGESDVDRRKQRKKVLDESGTNGKLSQSRESLICNVFRDTQRYSRIKSPESLGPFDFKCSPLPKRTKQGSKRLQPAGRSYEKSKKEQLRKKRLNQSGIGSSTSLLYAGMDEEFSFSDITKDVTPSRTKKRSYSEGDGHTSESLSGLKSKSVETRGKKKAEKERATEIAEIREEEDTENIGEDTPITTNNQSNTEEQNDIIMRSSPDVSFNLTELWDNIDQDDQRKAIADDSQTVSQTSRVAVGESFGESFDKVVTEYFTSLPKDLLPPVENDTPEVHSERNATQARSRSEEELRITEDNIDSGDDMGAGEVPHYSKTQKSVEVETAGTNVDRRDDDDRVEDNDDTFEDNEKRKRVKQKCDKLPSVAEQNLKPVSSTGGKAKGKQEGRRREQSRESSSEEEVGYAGEESDVETTPRRSPRVKKKVIAKQKKQDVLCDNDDDDDDIIKGMRNNFAKIINQSANIGHSSSPRSVKRKKGSTSRATPKTKLNSATKPKSILSRKDKTTIDYWRENNQVGDNDKNGDEDEYIEEILKAKDHCTTPVDPFKFDIGTPKNNGLQGEDSGFVDKTLTSTGGNRKRTNDSRASGSSGRQETPGISTKRSRRFGSLDVSHGGTPRAGYRSNEEVRRFNQNEGGSDEETSPKFLSQPTSSKKSRVPVGTKRKQRSDDIGFVSGPFTAYPARRRKKQALNDEFTKDGGEEETVVEENYNFDLYDSATPITMDDELSAIKPRKLFGSADYSAQVTKKRVFKSRREERVEDEIQDEEGNDEISLGDEVNITLANLRQDMTKSIKKRQGYITQMANCTIKLIVSKSQDMWEKQTSKRNSLLSDYMRRVNKYTQDHQDLSARKQESEDKILTQIKKYVENAGSQRKEQEKCLRNITKTQRAFSEAYEELENDSKNQQTHLQHHLRNEMLRYRDQIVKEVQKQEIGNIKRRVQAMIGASL